MIGAVIFDIDGTLIDSVEQHARAWQDALRRFGRDVPLDELRRQIGKGGDQMLPDYFSEDELRRRGEDIEAYRTDLFRRVYLPTVQPFPAVRELFHRIKSSGRRIALASSCKANELDGYKELAGIADLVDTATCSDDVERSKPAPDIFEAVLGKLQPIAAFEAVAIGDTPYDAEAANRAGLRTIGFLSGGFSEDDLRDAGCMAVYRDPADLLAKFDGSLLAGSPSRAAREPSAESIDRA
jgi:HAD superfamily hydrolase (TIGR01509 family)